MGNLRKGVPKKISAEFQENWGVPKKNVFADFVRQGSPEKKFRRNLPCEVPPKPRRPKQKK